MNNFSMMMMSAGICSLITNPWWGGALFGAIVSLIAVLIWDFAVCLFRSRT